MLLRTRRPVTWQMTWDMAHRRPERLSLPPTATSPHALAPTLAASPTSTLTPPASAAADTRTATARAWSVWPSMLQESKFAAEGGDAATAGAHASTLAVGAPPRSASTSAAAGAATADDATLRKDLASPASGGFDRRGAARYSLSRALQAGVACSPADADAAARRLEAVLHCKCPANSNTYEQRYFKLASELRADAAICNSVLTGDDLSAEVAVVLLDVMTAQTPALPAGAGAHISAGGGATSDEAAPLASAPDASMSPHHPAAGLPSSPPEPESGEGREASPRHGGGLQWSGASAAATAADASRDLRCLTEQLAALHSASGVEIALNNPTLLHLRRDPEILIAALRDALAPGGAALTWRSETEALRALVPMCRHARQAARALEAQQRAARSPVPLEPLAAPLPVWRSPKKPKEKPQPQAEDSAAEQQECVQYYTKETAKAAGLEMVPRSLFIKLLPMDVQPAELAALFATFGAVDFVICPPAPRKLTNGLAPTWRYGSVTMADDRGMKNALRSRSPEQKMVLRPDSPPVFVIQSRQACVPMGNTRDEWTAPGWVAPPRPKILSRVVEMDQQESPAGHGSRVRSRSREPRHRSSPQRRSGGRSPSPSRHRSRKSECRSRSRSRSRGRHGRRRGHSSSPAHATMPAAHVKFHTAPKKLPPMANLPTTISSFLTCSFFACPDHPAGQPIDVVGTPLAGACALPLPLSLELQWRVSQVEELGARLGRERLAVMALAGADGNATEALRQLATQLAAPAMVPGGQVQAAGMLATDGAAHFFLPLLCESALSLIRATALPGAPPPPLNAPGILVSLLLSDAAVALNKQAMRHTSHVAPRA